MRENDSNNNSLHVLSEIVPERSQPLQDLRQYSEATDTADSIYTLQYALSETFSDLNIRGSPTQDISHSAPDTLHRNSNSPYDICQQTAVSTASDTTIPIPSSLSSAHITPNLANAERWGIAEYITEDHVTQPGSYSSEETTTKTINPAKSPKVDPPKPWYCVTRPIHEQTRNLRISMTNKSSSINRSRLLEKCHSMMEFCMLRPQNEELTANNIEQLNFNSHWGDSLPKDVKGHTIRIVYQNVNKSLGAKPTPATYTLLSLLKQMEADVFMASETNRNWRSARFRNELKHNITRQWRHNRIAFSSSKIGDNFPDMEMLPGGTATMLFDHIATRTVKIGEDDEELGRWSYVTVEGQNSQKLTFITGYQICKGMMRGTTTSCMQQKQIIERNEMQQGKATSNPDNDFLRAKFIEDLIRFIMELKADGHVIILALDANETPQESFTNGILRHTSIEYLLQQTGLREVFQDRHQQTPDSTTTTPGRFIDRVATWGVDVERVTLLRANEPATSDHLAIVIDVKLQILFRNACSPLGTPSFRKLTSGNPEAVKSYVSFLKRQFQEHRIVTRIEKIKEAVNKNEFDEKKRRRLFALDKQITEIMIGAEKQCSKRCLSRNLWSPELDFHGNMIQYWKCRLALNGNIDEGTTDLGNALHIPLAQQQPLSIHECSAHLSQSWKKYRHIQKNAKAYRDKHLKARAELHAAKGNGDVQASIKHLKKQEQLKADYRSIDKAYGINKQGLTTLDVPDPSTGGRQLITDADAIHGYLLRRNELHYSQATYTTFGEAGPGFPYIDPDSPDSDKYIDDLLDGVFEPWDGASPFVKELLKELRCTVEEELDTTLHLHDFIAIFKTIPENTASSISGRHYGHYRILSKLDDDTFIRALFDMVDIAFRTKTPLPRWKGSTQIMLEKGKGPGIENLRIIQLLEADLNWLLRFLWGRKLNYHAMKAGAFNSGQYALPGKLCSSAILNRVLYFDMLRQTRQCGALLDNDATAAFDRVLPALCVVTCRQLGMPKDAQRFFFRILRQMVFTVTTAHGTSTATYSANGNKQAPGQGVIQGGGASGPNYSSQQHPVLKGVERHCTPAIYKHASQRKRSFKRWATGFADDMSLLLNDIGATSHTTDSLHIPISSRVRNALHDNLSRYETYFSTVGGALNLKKCFYYLVDFTWHGTGWRYKANSEIDAEPVLLTPTTLDDSGRPEHLAWLEANNAQRTLGAHIAPDGSNFRQFDVLLGHLDNWKQALRNIDHQNLRAKWLSYQNVYSKKIMYPLIGHCFRESDLLPLQKPTDIELLHLLGLNEHFSRAVLHAPLSLAGLGCPTYHAQHIADKLVLFLHHIRANDKIAEVFYASMSMTQIECGMSTPFFQIPAKVWHDLVTPTWIAHIWQECEPKGIDIVFDDTKFWIPKPQREHDLPIMELAEHIYGNSVHLRNINQCRLSLQVTYISDITSVDGKRVLQAYYEGVGHAATGRRTRLNWPPIGKLPAHYWILWKDFLHRVCGTSLRLPTRLGGWYASPETLTRLPYFLRERRLFLHTGGNNWCEFLPYAERSRSRFRLQNIPFHDIHLLNDAQVVDVTRTSDCLYVVSKSDQTIISDDTQQEVNTIQDLYCQLPASLQRLMGTITWPDEETTRRLAEAIRQGSAVGVSDGSVRTSDAKASHAWIIQTAVRADSIEGMGPVDGNLKYLTSHRAEIQGQAGIFLMVALLVQFYNVVRGHIKTYCDNKAVVSKLQHGWELFRLRHTKGPDSDIQATLRELIQHNGNRFTTKTEWVQGHQDDGNILLYNASVPQPVTLNIQIDAATKIAYNLPSAWHTTEIMPVLPSEGCAVYIANQKIVSSIYPTLLEQWHAEDAKQYLLSRHGIDANLFPRIQWGAMKYALSKFSHHRRATLVKAIHRHLPTQSKLFLQGRVTMCALCPRCLQTEETNAHIYACQNIDAIRKGTQDWGECQKQLAKVQTATMIIRVWAVHLRPLLGLPPATESLETIVSNTHGELNGLIRAAIDEQGTIGWNKLLLGMASTHWYEIQHLIDINKPKPPERNATTWINSAIHQLLKFSLRCWKERNNMIHGATYRERQQKALEAVCTKITAIYTNPPKLAPQFRRITEVPLLHRLRLPLQAAEHWLALIDHQIKVTKHNMKILLSQHRPIPAHLSSMEQERARNRLRMQQSPSQDTPRRAHSRKVQHDVKKMRMRLYRSIPALSRSNDHRSPPRIGRTLATPPRRRPAARYHPP